MKEGSSHEGLLTVFYGGFELWCTPGLSVAPWWSLTCAPWEPSPPAPACPRSWGEPGTVSQTHLPLHGEDGAGGTQATAERPPVRHGIAVLPDRPGGFVGEALGQLGCSMCCANVDGDTGGIE